MSDGDLDAEWKPNGRPQSTMARSFSAALHDIFDVDNSLDSLSQSVEQKKKAVTSQSQELEALEARIRRTEELLKAKQSASRSGSPSTGHSSPHRRPAIGTTFESTAEETDDRKRTTSPLSRNPPKESRSRPGTARNNSHLDHVPPPVPGGFPPTANEANNNEYVVVDRDEGRAEPERPKSSARYKRSGFGPPPNRPPPPPFP